MGKASLNFRFIRRHLLLLGINSYSTVLIAASQMCPPPIASTNYVAKSRSGYARITPLFL